MSSCSRWLTLFVLIAVSGCTQAVAVHDSASLPDDEVATIVGGDFPNLQSVDQVSLEPGLFTLRPDATIPAGSHTLLIDYQPCRNSNLCSLTSVGANVVLEPGQSYEIRHRTVGCNLWTALTAIVRSEIIPCRNFLWIEDQATGEAIWGNAPVKVTG